jgi:uncharacterized protein (UPF0335 family)
MSGDSVAHDQIKAFVERIERLDEELKSINDDKKEVFAEAKGNGFDVKALKIVIRKRAQDHAERMELEALVELYEAALGMRAYPRDYDEDDEPSARAPARTRETIEEFGAEQTPFEQIHEGLTEALAVAKGEAEPYRAHYAEPANASPEADAADSGEESGMLDSLPANQSTAALKEVQGPAMGVSVAAVADASATALSTIEPRVSLPAGTQAPPVDTHFPRIAHLGLVRA